MNRREKDFLTGFQRAAELMRNVITTPPAYTTAQEYVRDVADLHRDSQDFVSRGLAVGCLVALGRS